MGEVTGLVDVDRDVAAGPSAIGSEKGMPISMASAPASAIASTSASALVPA